MSITDKTRKMLWGKAGNRCAICRCKLVEDATSQDEASIIGDECHIIAKEINGPRGNYPRPADLDAYDNLILLCKVHHKMVDDQLNTYHPTYLIDLKTSHEHWVHESLSEKKIKDKSDPNHFLFRIIDGRSLMNIIANGCEMYSHTHDELNNEEEVELVSVFLQEIQDYGDLINDMESGQRVKLSFEFSKRIKELEENNFWVFGGNEIHPLRVSNKEIPMSCSIIRITRSDNPEIVSLKLDDTNDVV